MKCMYNIIGSVEWLHLLMCWRVWGYYVWNQPQWLLSLPLWEWRQLHCEFDNYCNKQWIKYIAIRYIVSIDQRTVLIVFQVLYTVKSIVALIISFEGNYSAESGLLSMHNYSLHPRTWWMATSVIVHQDGLGTDVRQGSMNAVPTLVRIMALALWVCVARYIHVSTLVL